MKIHPYITERLLMGRKKSNQTNKQERPFNIFANIAGPDQAALVI